MLQAMLTFFTKPNNMKNAALKSRSGGKACYTTSQLDSRISKIFFNKGYTINIIDPNIKYNDILI